MLRTDDVTGEGTHRLLRYAPEFDTDIEQAMRRNPDTTLSAMMSEVPKGAVLPDLRMPCYGSKFRAFVCVEGLCGIAGRLEGSFVIPECAQVVVGLLLLDPSSAPIDYDAERARYLGPVTLSQIAGHARGPPPPTDTRFDYDLDHDTLQALLCKDGNMESGRGPSYYRAGEHKEKLGPPFLPRQSGELPQSVVKVGSVTGADTPPPTAEPNTFESRVDWSALNAIINKSEQSRATWVTGHTGSSKTVTSIAYAILSALATPVDARKYSVCVFRNVADLENALSFVSRCVFSMSVMDWYESLRQYVPGAGGTVGVIVSDYCYCNAGTLVYFTTYAYLGARAATRPIFADRLACIVMDEADYQSLQQNEALARSAFWFESVRHTGLPMLLLCSATPWDQPRPRILAIHPSKAQNAWTRRRWARTAVRRRIWFTELRGCGQSWAQCTATTLQHVWRD